MNRDDFMVKGKVFNERRAQDLRKTAINENALNLCLEKSQKNEAFAKLQDIIRTDTRIAETSDMIEKGITGLEPLVEKTQNLQSSISAAAGEETPEKMEESFKLADDKVDTLFSYLDELLKDIHQMEGEIDKLKEENRDLFKGMSSMDRKMRRDIKMNQDDVQKKLEEANKASQVTDEAKNALDSVLESVKDLYPKICPNDDTSLQDHPIDDSNVMDYLQSMEKQLLDYLILVEYIRMKEASKEEKPLLLEEEEDDDAVDDSDNLADLDTVQPRTLQSECDLQSLMELEAEASFLEFEDLKDKAVAAIAEVQSENIEDDAEYTVSSGKTHPKS